MPRLTQFPSGVVATDFLRATMNAMTIPAVDALLAQLPVTDVNKYHYDDENPEKGWVEGNFHWIPVGRDRGNAGRIKLAGKPVYPLAERLVNGMEALIELKRLRELAVNKDAPPPLSPREAVKRYFGLPPLDQVPKLKENAEGKAIYKSALALSRELLLTVNFDKKRKEFAVSIRDHGMGQTAIKMHRTLLSLGTSDKGDKPYLIGVFGQGGSSTYAASKCSWIVTRCWTSSAAARKIAWDGRSSATSCRRGTGRRISLTSPLTRTGACPFYPRRQETPSSSSTAASSATSDMTSARSRQPSRGRCSRP